MVCQLNKTKRKKTIRLLQPLPFPEKLWENISMNFITEFPKVRDFKSIFVIVDRFSKYFIFITTPDACPMEEVDRLFFRPVVKNILVCLETL